MNNIERRQLGRTGLSVTVLGFGGMDLGGPPAAQQISSAERSARERHQFHRHSYLLWR
jgi:aryl-alcohol dehydrogenase-like predicted oxidoreductase